MKQQTFNHDDIFPIEAILDKEYFRESNILNILPAAVYTCDVSGQIISYNQKAVELWGRTPKKGDKDERYCGAFKLYYPDGTHLPHHETPVAACLIDGLPRRNLEVIIERPDLSRTVVRVNIVPIKNANDELIGMINCFFDITQQKQAQKELDKKTRELQDYVDNASIGLHWVDENGIIIWANKAELDMLGYSQEEYIGRHISQFHVYPEKIEDILRRLSCNETLNGYESVLRCKDGSTRIVQISSNVFWNEGRFKHTRCFTVDVTEQKQLYESLQKSEARYKHLLNNLPAGVYTCDNSGRITFFNELAVKLWGYRPAMGNGSVRFCAAHKVWIDGTLVQPEESPMAMALQTGQSFSNVEALMERRDGTLFHANMNIDPLKDEHGEVTGAINIFQDISALKEAEIALKESEVKYRTLVQHLNVPIYTTDAEGRVTLYNKAAADLWGREPQIGEEYWCGSYRIARPDGSELPLEECPMAICLKEQRPVYGEEIVVVRPDGTRRNVAPHPQPVFDSKGNIVAGINMLIDITEIKLKEEALRESEQRYRELVAVLERKVEEKTKDLQQKNDELKKSEERYHKMVDEVEDYAIILLDKQGNILNWNRGAEEINGYKEEEIIGKNFELFYLEEDRKNDIPRKLISEAAVNGKATIEGWRIKKDGTRFWGNIVIAALHDESGNIIGYTKVTRDLTERKLAEDKLREYSNMLQFQNSELEQFVYAASHDMKAPLRKIHLYNSLIKENEANILDGKSLEFLDRSLGSVERLTNLIEDLLAYSRTTANTDNVGTVDFNIIIQEVLAEHKDELEQKRIKVELATLPVIQAVFFQCKQLMDNLINNAIKYASPEREGLIKLESKLVRGADIHNKGVQPSKIYHQISVIDNGIGFDMQNAEKMFEVFQRLHNTRNIKGTGIGLAICKKIVQNHKGVITATGSINHGARFDVYFPRDAG